MGIPRSIHRDPIADITTRPAQEHIPYHITCSVHLNHKDIVTSRKTPCRISPGCCTVPNRITVPCRIDIKSKPSICSFFLLAIEFNDPFVKNTVGLVTISQTISVLSTVFRLRAASRFQLVPRKLKPEL